MAFRVGFGSALGNGLAEGAILLVSDDGAVGVHVVGYVAVWATRHDLLRGIPGFLIHINDLRSKKTVQ